MGLAFSFDTFVSQSRAEETRTTSRPFGDQLSPDPSHDMLGKLDIAHNISTLTCERCLPLPQLVKCPSPRSNCLEKLPLSPAGEPGCAYIHTRLHGSTDLLLIAVSSWRKGLPQRVPRSTSPGADLKSLKRLPALLQETWFRTSTFLTPDQATDIS